MKFVHAADIHLDSPLQRGRARHVQRPSSRHRPAAKDTEEGVSRRGMRLVTQAGVFHQRLPILIAGIKTACQIPRYSRKIAELRLQRRFQYADTRRSSAGKYRPNARPSRMGRFQSERRKHLNR